MNIKLRVWLNRNGRTTYKNVATPTEAIEIIRKAIAKDLKDDSITMNAFGLEIYEDIGDGVEWSEWYANKNFEKGKYEGSDIMEIIEEKDEEKSN